MSPLTLARVPRDSCSNPQALGIGRESSRTDVRTRGNADPGLSRMGELVDTTGPWTVAGITRYSWSTPWALRPDRESLGRAG